MKDDKFKYIRENVSILDTAVSLGFTPVKKGKYYSLKEHDSIMINRERNVYWQNSVPGSGSCIGEQGSVIDFMMKFGNMSLYEVVKEFERYVPDEGSVKRKSNNDNAKRICPPDETDNKKAAQELVLPKKDKDMHKVFAYLIKTRCISADVVSDMVKRKMLYQDIHGNCVFVGYDLYDKQKPVFATKRGTNTYRPFYGDVSGCDYDKCIYIDNKSETLCITESVIDAMSIMTITEDSDEPYDYLILAGVGKWKSIETYLNFKKYASVLIALDNDAGGMKASDLIWDFMDEKYININKTKIPPLKEQGKDWNEVLQRAGGQR